ncbi:MAG: phosphoglycerate kinase [Candidatus Melainabacteria bacterium]|jgi:phosphoglycerate kinase|nr:phosphoglycerate kinase [Candidatus Melainabacteria bacterium]
MTKSSKKTIRDLGKDAFKDKTVLVRVDFNVPQKEDGTVSDDSRIKGALSTIDYLASAGAKVVLVSHLGRPKGKPAPKYSLKPVAEHLKGLLAGMGHKVVHFVEDCVGEKAESAVKAMKAGEVALLENVRFYEEEEKNAEDFAKKLAKLAEIYVNDAFGTAHRAHASTEGVTRFIKPALAGDLVAKEIEMLSSALDEATCVHPFATIIGGAKVSSKIGVLENLLSKVDVLIIGGAMAFSFLKAQGLNTGKSLVEDDKLDYCRELIEKAKAKGVKLVLPLDVVVAAEIKEGVQTEIVDADKIPSDKMGLDVGPKTIKAITEALKDAKTVLWNGPLGVFEVAGFEKGTYALIDNLIELTAGGARTIVGGGDSVSALKQKGVEDSKVTHVGTGGGASLEYLEGIPLPGIACLEEKEAALSH